MLQKNRLYCWVEQLIIAGLLSSVYATQAFSLSWMNRDSYRVGSQGVGLDYFLSAHNTNALGYGGIQFNINHFFNDPLTFSYGAGYRRFIMPYVQAGIYFFADSLADSEVDAAFSNINIGFEATYYRWLGDINIYYPMDARSPASSNLTTFYIENNPHFGIDVKVGRLLFNQTTVKGGVYYFSHEKEELSTLGGGIHFSYPVTRRSTVDIKWICDTSLQNKWVISWQFNRSSPHDQTNRALWRPIDRPVSAPMIFRRIKSNPELSGRAVFTLKGKKLNQFIIEKIKSDGYNTIVLKEACSITDSYIDIKDLSLSGILKKGSGYNKHRVELPVLKGQSSIAMGSGSRIINLVVELSPIGQAPGLIINEGANNVLIEGSEVTIETYLHRNSKRFSDIEIGKGASVTFKDNNYITGINNNPASEAKIYLMDIKQGAKIQGSGNGNFSLASLSTQDTLRFYPKFFSQNKSMVKSLGIAQSLTPYRYISDGETKKRREDIAKIAGVKEDSIAEKLRIDHLTRINELEKYLRKYPNYNEEARARYSSEQVRTQYQDILTLLTQGEKSLPQEIKSLEEKVNSAYEKVYHEWEQAKVISSNLKKALPDSLEAFKQKRVIWFGGKIHSLKQIKSHIKGDIEIIDQYLCAKANKEWVEETKKDLIEAYEEWESFLAQEKKYVNYSLLIS